MEELFEAEVDNALLSGDIGFVLKGINQAHATLEDKIEIISINEHQIRGASLTQMSHYFIAKPGNRYHYTSSTLNLAIHFALKCKKIIERWLGFTPTSLDKIVEASEAKEAINLFSIGTIRLAVSDLMKSE